MDVPALARLMAVASLAAVAWRAEVEWHGWHGLTWLGYFHWAVPFGFALFLAWLAAAPAAPEGRRGWVVAAAGVYGVASLLLIRTVLASFFVAGPLAMLASPANLEVQLAAVFVGVPAGAFALGRAMGAKLPILSLPASVCLFAAQIPFAIALLSVIEPRHADDIHTIKTGAAIPFAVVGMGLPWAYRRKDTRASTTN